jgi:general secretion pathway protein K
MTMETARKRERQRGMALLMVLIALAILGSMTADLLESNDVYLATAVNARDAKQAEYLAKSGINLARLTLSFQEMLGKAANFPFWQYTDMVIPMFTSKDGGFLGDFTGTKFSEDTGLGLKGLPDDADLQVKIVDEDSKMNVNISNESRSIQSGQGSGARQMLRQLTYLTASEDYDLIFDETLATDQLSTREEIICEFIDFTDADEDLCDQSGAEDRSLYTSFDPPYERKNAPFDSLEEIRLLSGVTDDFYSAFVDPKPEDPDSRIMTVWGRGKININTAPAALTLPAICDLASNETINYCEDPNNLLNAKTALYFANMTKSVMPFSSFDSFAAMIIDPGKSMMGLLLGLGDVAGVPLEQSKIREQKSGFTTTSTVFSIYSTATVGKVTKRIHMVVNTKDEDQLLFPEDQSVSLAGGKVLYYRME